jgi:hypothetical protein
MTEFIQVIKAGANPVPNGIGTVPFSEAVLSVLLSWTENQYPPAPICPAGAGD